MRDIQIIVVALLAMALPLLGLADADPAITECDRLAAHPEDPDHIGIGVPTQKVDLQPMQVIGKRNLSMGYS